MRVLHSVVHAVSSVFGCQHDRLTRPFTIQKKSYMVCLNCGHEVFYSMDEMRRLTRREVRRLQAVAVPELRIAPAGVELEPSMHSKDPSLAA